MSNDLEIVIVTLIVLVGCIGTSLFLAFVIDYIAMKPYRNKVKQLNEAHNKAVAESKLYFKNKV